MKIQDNPTPPTTSGVNDAVQSIKRAHEHLQEAKRAYDQAMSSIFDDQTTDEIIKNALLKQIRNASHGITNVLDND